ncbi:hypothetical protein ACIRPK_20605 [Kitasatospora sp. NPDC101801]|uniref:hypothetical protein n=1 Tax=Kitasatospora sp. NPDC101801 TaxID=3364103 RepID=UPI00381062FB
MTLPTQLASAEKIHDYLIDQLNLALRRPGMFGGEVALRVLVDHLLFVEGQPEEWSELVQGWEEQGLWTSIGPSGAFQEVFPAQGGGYEVASVYAEFAQRRGWLKPDRVLTAEEYEALTGQVRGWAAVNRTWADVTAEFGPPSVLFGGNNPLYGKTLGYCPEDLHQPMVVFHLWNGSEPGTEPWPPEHAQPFLLAVRFGGGSFRRSLTFTPEGTRRKPIIGDPFRSQ